MAEIQNNTPGHLIFSVMGEEKISKAFNALVEGQVVTQVVETTATRAKKSIIIPPNVPRDGLDGRYTLTKTDLQALKGQKEFDAAVKRRDVTIVDHG